MKTELGRPSKKIVSEKERDNGPHDVTVTSTSPQLQQLTLEWSSVFCWRSVSGVELQRNTEVI